jgi:hypothetical protein
MDEVPLILKQTTDEAGRSVLKIVPVKAQMVVAGIWAEK